MANDEIVRKVITPDETRGANPENQGMERPPPPQGSGGQQTSNQQSQEA